MDIDIVIPWVDGSDPVHSEKRSRYLSDEEKQVAPDGIHRRRWSNADELGICMMSIARYAPWVRKIWVVTDNQQPQFPELPENIASKIVVIDHRHIFRDYEEFLPIFNSLSIGTMLYRIEGLADQFILFNDDTFFFLPVEQSDFFRGENLVLRGNWLTMNAAERGTFLSTTYRTNKLEAAKRVGFDQSRYFSLAHVMQPLDKTLLAGLFDQHPDWLIANIGHRFRSPTQFSIASLNAHLAIKSGRATLIERRDWRNFSSRWCAKAAGPRAFLELMLTKMLRRKLICVNDLALLETKFSWFRPMLLRLMNIRTR